MSLLEELSNKLQNKEITPVELLESYFEKIEQIDAKLKAFIEVQKEEALEQARESQKRIEENKSLSIYDGIPIGIKDNILQKNRKVEAASKILEGFVSPYDATVIQKLKAKGFITVGRLNMDEFAMGSSTENSSIQVTSNPHDYDYVPGGSSGGSAAAVAADLMPVSLGSDTGGSIRQPASFCGITGLKPTYGSVSRYGLIAFASSLDQIGPFAKSSEDVKIIYDIIYGYDENDSTCVSDQIIAEKRKIHQDKKPSAIKIGCPKSLLNGISPEVQKSFDAVIDFLEKEVLENNKVVDIDLPNQEYAIPVYYLTATSEASANLARFDGVRYGKRSDKASNLNEVYEKSRTEGFGQEVKRRILLGTYALSSGFYDAFYGKSQKVRNLIREGYEKAFEKVDVIVLPVSPILPFKKNEKISDPVEMYLIDALTVGASLAGIPAISVPGPADKLPIGFQIQGPNFSEDLLFKLGSLIEEKFAH